MRRERCIFCGRELATEEDWSHPAMEKDEPHAELDALCWDPGDSSGYCLMVAEQNGWPTDFEAEPARRGDRWAPRGATMSIGALLRDASVYRTHRLTDSANGENFHVPVWHVAIPLDVPDPGGVGYFRTGCGRLGAEDTLREDINAIPTDARCQRNGCRQEVGAIRAGGAAVMTLLRHHPVEGAGQ